LSKYDEYWLSIIDSIANLIKEAYTYGKSRSLDVLGLRRCGKRGNWYGSIIISRNGILKGNMAHVVALGKIILRKGLLEDYGDAVFRIRVSSKLKLDVELVEYQEVKHAKSLEHKQSYEYIRGFTDHYTSVSEDIYLRIHELLELLPLHRYPIRRQGLPSNGIYFFYEEGEVIKIDNRVIKRIVRVGTHREQGRFPGRILDHFHGNKNSSVFRRHLGAAILAKENPHDPRLKEWIKGTKPLKDIEEKVSKLLTEKFSFRYIRVDDRDERLELEERLISTVARFSPKYVSPNWLGRCSPSREIRESGLWNVEHVDSPKHIGPKQLARLKQLVYETLATETKGKRALILIPCCKTKNVYPTSNALSTPLPGVDDLRNKLLKLLQATPWLREKPENRRGVLNPNAPLTRAIDLYAGPFYQKTKKVLLDVLHGKYPHIHILIVSALYGLVKLDEGIKEYELAMYDKLVNGIRVYRFWQREGLWKILLDYIRRNNITHVWSLLPSSTQYPYHQVFEDLWRTLRNTPIKCIHVEVPEAGSGTGIKRAEWLVHIVEDNPLYLVCQPPPPRKLEQIPNYTFQYLPC